MESKTVTTGQEKNERVQQLEKDLSKISRIVDKRKKELKALEEKINLGENMRNSNKILIAENRDKSRCLAKKQVKLRKKFEPEYSSNISNQCNSEGE